MNLDILIAKSNDFEDFKACAKLMSSSEPWLTLRRNYEESLKNIQDPAKEVYIAKTSKDIVGFIVLLMVGPFRGYVQVLCVSPDFRSKGLGAQLLGFVEKRVFTESPNLFLCVSSFNEKAQKFYTRLGYQQIGTIPDFVEVGYSEFLMRKTIGSLNAFFKAF